MKRYRVSIAGVMVLILVAGLVLVLVRIEQRLVSSSLEGWVNALAYATVASLVAATYRARYCRGRQGDWWFGFALGGWSYLLLSGEMMWQWSWPTHEPESLVRSLPHWIVANIPLSWMDYVVLAYSFMGADVVRSCLTRIVASLLVLFAAFAGGVICLVLCWRSRSSPLGSESAP
jgi:hypothetical protein